jgi:hypothetical protein
LLNAGSLSIGSALNLGSNALTFNSGSLFLAAGTTISNAITLSGLGNLGVAANSTGIVSTNLTAGSILANNANALGTGTITVSSTGIRLVVGNGLTVANAVIIGANSGAAGRGII